MFSNDYSAGSSTSINGPSDASSVHQQRLTRDTRPNASHPTSLPQTLPIKMNFLRKNKAPGSTSASAASGSTGSLSRPLTLLHQSSSSALTTDPSTAASIATNDTQATGRALIAFLGKLTLADGIYLVVGDEHEPGDHWKSAPEMNEILEDIHFRCYTTLVAATQFEQGVVDRPDHAESIRSGVGELRFPISPPRCSVLLQ